LVAENYIQEARSAITKATITDCFAKTGIIDSLDESDSTYRAEVDDMVPLLKNTTKT